MISVESALRWLTRRGLHRGLGGEGWPWLAIAGAAFLLQRTRSSDPDDLGTLEVHTGDRFELVAAPRLGRRARRRARRAEKAGDSGRDERESSETRALGVIVGSGGAPT